MKRGELRQKHRKMQNLISPELQSVPVPSEVMKQIMVINGYKHLAVCIDNFSKLTEAKQLKDKLVEFVSLFLYEIICRHDCMRIKINDQGKEFVNDAITKLHEMTVVDQRGIYAYHPQANGLRERQNRAIKDSLVKMLNAMPSGWSYVTEGVLFVHRVSRHSSTKYTSFFIMYNQQPVFPINIQQSQYN